VNRFAFRIRGQTLPVRTGRIHSVKRIIEHNYLDILSSAELLIKCGQINSSARELNDNAALLRLAKLASELDDFNYFINVNKLLAKENKVMPQKMVYLRSLFSKRRKEWKSAVIDWENLVSQKEYLFFALEELAKYSEHTAKNFEQALFYTDKALNHFSILEELNPYSINPEIKQAFLKRRKRLNGKMPSSLT